MNCSYIVTACFITLAMAAPEIPRQYRLTMVACSWAIALFAGRMTAQ